MVSFLAYLELLDWRLLLVGLESTDGRIHAQDSILLVCRFVRMESRLRLLVG